MKLSILLVPLVLAAQSSSGGGGGGGVGITPKMRGPLAACSGNSHYFCDQSNTPQPISGSHTWTTGQPLWQSTSTPITDTDWCCDANSWVGMLVASGHTATILWHKDLSRAFGWAPDGSTGPWMVDASLGMPWQRTGCGTGATASDGGLRYDFTQFNTAYFQRIRNRVIQLGQYGIWAIVEMQDGLSALAYRGTGDGYPFTGNATGGINNCNSIDDGYTSGNGYSSGDASFTMTSANSISAVWDAYDEKLIDWLNDLPNVIWEHGEETACGYNGSGNAFTWFNPHLVSNIHTYEAGKPFRHPVLQASGDVNCNNDTTMLYNSNADAVAPLAQYTTNSNSNNSGSGTPTNKVIFWDTDHSFGVGRGIMSNSAVQNRNVIWENVLAGANPLFMDPGFILWNGGTYAGPPARNSPASVTNDVGYGALDSRWSNFRYNLGFAATLLKKLDLSKVTVNGALTSGTAGYSSTGYVMGQTPGTGMELLIYVPSATGGSTTLTVNVSNASGRTINCSAYDLGGTSLSPVACNGGSFSGGSSSQTITVPSGITNGDAIIYLVDSAGHA